MGIMFWVWIIILVLTVIFEIPTTDLTSMWFSLGAFAALLLNLFVKHNLWWLQVIIFAVVATVSIIFFKPLLKKKMMNQKAKTNIDALINKTVVVVEPIAPNSPGTIKTEGIEWTAVTETDSFEPGDLVEIVSVAGNTFTVKKLSKKG